jgi:signal transduction histidine kinase
MIFLRGAATALLAIVCISAWGAYESSWPFIGRSAADRAASVQLLWIFLALPGMALAAAIEERKRAEDTLLRGQSRYELATAAGQAAVWSYNYRTQELFADPPLATMLGYTGNPSRTCNDWMQLIHPDDLEAVVAREQGVIRPDAPRNPSGNTPIPPIQFRFRCAGGIAHDFNNLLGAIHAHAELAEVSQEDGRFPGEEIEAIKTVSMRASEIVRRLVIFAGHEKSSFEPLDLSRLAGEMVALLSISIAKGALLQTDLAVGLPSVLGNESQIHQVAMNLVLNASDALGEKRGVIRIATSLEAEMAADAGSSPGGALGRAFVKLVVSDTCSGISKEAQARIFDPFFTTKFAGRGLGLAVVQGIVRAHKGIIRVDSVPREGAAFQILWPTTGAGLHISHSNRIVMHSNRIVIWLRRRLWKHRRNERF